MRFYIILIICSLTSLVTKNVFAQGSIKWWNPAKNQFSVLQGQGWHGGLASPYDRLPLRIKKALREPVWYLSQDPSGLIVRFRSNAGEIHVRYTVTRKVAWPHMPATGASGVDLYATDNTGNWDWTAGKYHFGDTITYDFSHLKRGDRSYYLYLPLYNKVSWLEIGVADTAKLVPEHPSTRKPIVVYGTSIAQGIAASRPGMSWTALLGRKLHLPIINLAFSGNGQLEAPIVGLMSELDARLYILDCMPNMWYSFIPSDTVKARLLYAVQTLKKEHPKTPILLVEDADVAIMPLDTSRYHPYERVNTITRRMFQELIKSGVQGLYLLGADAIGLNDQSTTEGTHPNDYGMIQYSRAYAKKIQQIFRQVP